MVNRAKSFMEERKFIKNKKNAKLLYKLESEEELHNWESKT